MNLLYIPGFLGSPQESKFLEESSLKVISFDYFQSTLDPDQALIELINDEKPEILYAYSMGGRLLLSLYDKLHYKPKKVFLESVGLSSLSLEEKKSRLSTDKLRADSLIKDAHQFIEEWYRLPLWQFSTVEYREMVTTKKDLLKKVDNTHSWSKLLYQYSPGHFPKEEIPFQTIVSENSEIHYMAGEKDTKYFTLARTLEDSIKDCKRIHFFPACGHNIHFQQPKEISKLLKTFLF
ncbi:MAG: hypothetical protein NXH75_18320 [Halobacteriovoraceae bacterium]|nr:hypothetical protein [Halobacteriovoraceae bacterium]